MLVFAAHVPHTPLLIPTIGRENFEALKKTRNSLKIVAEELYATHPEVIIILASHGNPAANSFAVNLNNYYQTDFSEFGDLVTKIKYTSELNCADRLQRYVRRSNVPFTMFSNPSLDHAVAVPLISLTEKLKKITILPFFTANKLSAKNHFEFGRLLKEIVFADQKRIAVISAGDLSHALSPEAPAGLHPEGKKFDSLIREAINSTTSSGLLQLEPKFIAQAAECGYLSILTLLGLIEGLKLHSEELCYEKPFGVGLLTAQFYL